jgi:transketolase
MNALRKLLALGQSCWIDDLSRHMIRSGELARLAEEGVRGVTSNPATFEKAIAGSRDYESDVTQLAMAGASPDEIYDELVTTDVRNACDILRPVFEESGGVDGFVSLDVSPHLAHDTSGSIETAKRLFARVGRPNVFIKIPGTAAGVPAVEELIFEGINVNITLLFSITSYEAVAEAYMRGLERRVAAGRSLDCVASVASFFLSRIDTRVDELLQQRIKAAAGKPRDPDPRSVLGRVAIANAKLAYQAYKHLVATERWKSLAGKGARVQRLLWASTSTKNPAYPELMYVEPLIGPDTVSTMPKETLAALLRHDRIETTIELGLSEAKRVMADLTRLGIDFAHVAKQLEENGIKKFVKPHDAVMAQLAAKSAPDRRAEQIEPLRRVARKLRRLVIQMTTAAGSGHPTSCMSCADIVAALFFRHMRWDPTDPHARNVDTFVLSKGHAAPILWAALHEAGAISDDLMTLRRFGSSLEGHPTPNNPWVKAATGSLGQGLAAGNGMAEANRLDKIDARVFCLLGDGECSEGSVWEAAQFASLNRLANIVAIVDVNGLGQSDRTPYQHDTGVFARRFGAFGWRTIEIDGHDITAILTALVDAETSGPTAILARTEKGKGVSFLEGASGWHGKVLTPEQMEKALAELGDPGPIEKPEPRRVGQYAPRRPASIKEIEPKYRLGESVATRQAFGRALEQLGALDPDIVVLDGDVRNSTGTELFAKKFPERFFESYIAEQNMVGTALGLAAFGKIACAATFACFLTRAYDFIRMAEYSRPPHLILCGSHAGVSIGEDGPSQMGLEDIAMFRALIESTVLYPADAVSTERLTQAAMQVRGIAYIRTTRSETPVIYDSGERFPVGGSKTLRASDGDRAAIVAAGITLHEALAAHESLAKRGIRVRVIDAYSVKPLDEETLVKAAREAGRLVVVEDHAINGGLGDAVAAAVGGMAPVHRLGIAEMPRSGKKDELLEHYGISRHAIEERVLSLAA